MVAPMTSPAPWTRDLDVEEDPVVAWARSGAMALTGRPDGPPLGPPSPLVPGLRAIADVLAERTGHTGPTVRVDPIALLGERAAMAGLRRGGAVSCGGGTRLLEAADGWIAVSLTRPEDLESVPAWLGVDATWPSISAAVADRSTADVVDQGVLLGLPVAALGTQPVPPPGLPVTATRLSADPPARGVAGARVVDLTSLWAGPLCGSLLADGGARVTKVESTTRPDGARRGTRAFFDLLQAGNETATVDITTEDGRQQLAARLAGADIVLEASRPRALEQLGIDRDELLREGGPQVWVSITGYGRVGPARDRVAFGDDASIAGGLVAWDEVGPCFCADAVADPATGLTAAAAVADALSVGGRWTIDIALASVAAHLAGPTLPVPDGLEAAPPRARTR
jgi:hypothetical protein